MAIEIHCKAERQVTSQKSRTGKSGKSDKKKTAKIYGDKVVVTAPEKAGDARKGPYFNFKTRVSHWRNVDPSKEVYTSCTKAGPMKCRSQLDLPAVIKTGEEKVESLKRERDQLPKAKEKWTDKERKREKKAKEVELVKSLNEQGVVVFSDKLVSSDGLSMKSLTKELNDLKDEIAKRREELKELETKQTEIEDQLEQLKNPE